MRGQSNYWKNRFDQIEQSANNKSVKYTKQLEKKYKAAAQELDQQINAWYQRLADNNEVTITEARKLLTTSELKEFKWTVEEYIRYGQENAIDQRWMKELENASAKFHINRLEALRLQARQQVEQLFAGGQQSMFDTLADVYRDTFYHSCYEIQKGVGVGFDVSRLDDNQVSRLLMKPWSPDGENFSTKVWKNKTKLLNALDQELSRMILTGQSPRTAIANIRKAMNTSQYAAERLVLTEQAYFTSVAQKDAYGELDVEEYEIVATLDNKTSKTCQNMDGQHFPVKEMQAGVNAPPFHVFCRTTTCPYFDDEFTVNNKRVAKNEKTGEWYEVPADMKYHEWKNSFVDGGDKKKSLGDMSDEEVEAYLHQLEFEKIKWLKDNNYDIYGDDVYDMENGFLEESEDGSYPEGVYVIDSINKKIENLYGKLGYKNIVDDGKKSYTKTIKGEHSIVDDLKATNPNYDPNNYKWSNNCQRCVPAYEMRRRGFDVSAKPRKKGNDETARSWKDIFKNAQWENCGTNRKDSTIQNIVDNMQKYGDGSRAEIYVVWKVGRSSHVFVAENVGGKIKFIDPQTNNEDVTSYFDDIKTTRTEMCRIDNLDTTELIKGCCG